MWESIWLSDSGCPRGSCLLIRLQEVLLDSLMTSSDAPSAEVVQCWIWPTEMLQEAHEGEKKRKLRADHQAKARAKKVIILGRTFNVL